MLLRNSKPQKEKAGGKRVARKGMKESRTLGAKGQERAKPTGSAALKRRKPASGSKTNCSGEDLGFLLFGDSSIPPGVRTHRSELPLLAKLSSVTF